MKKEIYTFLVSGTSESRQVIRPAYFGLRKEKQTLIHWTITGATIEGEEKTAGFAASICYVANGKAYNGKAYGYIDIPGYYKPGETGHTAISNRAVVFDLYNQKMTKIKIKPIQSMLMEPETLPLHAKKQTVK